MRPLLLLLVFGAFLAVVGATATGQAVLVTLDGSTNYLSARVEADATIVRSLVNLHLQRTDVGSTVLPADREAALDRQLLLITDQGQILRAAILGPTGVVLAASDGGLVGRAIGPDSGFERAVAARSVDASIDGVGETGPLGPSTTGEILREYFPIIADGTVYAVVAVWRDAAPIFATLDESRLHVVLITLSAALVTGILLYLIFRTAQGRLTRQTVQLLESTRRDPLTGLLNHGAGVEVLALALERARDGADGTGGVAVAIVDLDNFGLLNDTYGHAAGDSALLEVERLLTARLPDGATAARYGPDEFMIVAAAAAASALEPALEGLRTSLADLELTFGASERLPVTVSAGICSFPTNGESVTTLLAIAAVTLDAAKASGGDSILVAEARPAVSAHAQTFDVLQGLIIAVDTKDRYTRRHSEDVARYADFLAGRLGLDADARRAIHSAGLLHDIGKIGIPDGLLRKPGKLTDAEYDIVKQHVALGDAIVRDLPNIDLIRAGIRHHHERWDGDGYLDRLAGEQIPLVARILAVADAFSAMTTTRPYRKALSIDVALRRLEDAAGSQLDEALALSFVDGIRSDENPPLPGEQPEARLWTPDLRVA
ncbi:MAG TPA: diguanylate cyclase [Candidatus Limnocylindrales bacterium]|nr:diguanylate cyclase [Candidatus Limnocylindrales bacterium]